jgi:hypothetical protein
MFIGVLTSILSCVTQCILYENLQYWDFVTNFADKKATNGVRNSIKAWDEINSHKTR